VEHTEGRTAAPSLTYEEALEYITGLGRFGVKLGLERMHGILSELGDPQRGLRGVHVAGTNGKGSTSAMVESIARASGLRTGLYTSPHLCRFAERIRIDGEPIGDEAFERALGA
jgi:dihydrofolate synthase/folylpolyglutamate synthase